MINIIYVDQAPSASDINDYIHKHFNVQPQQINVVPLTSVPRAYDAYDLEAFEGTIITNYYGLRFESGIMFMEDLSLEAVSEAVASTYINPKVWFTDDLATTKLWLQTYDKFDIIACDFEATSLTIPQFNPLTMLSISWSYTKSTVIVFATKEIEDYVLNWLVTTEVKQVWHNALYDLRLIKYHTGKVPKSIEDSQLLAAVYNNHIDITKRKSGLKELGGTLYGDWASAKTSFDLYDTSMNDDVTNLIYKGTSDISKYNLALIKYAGIDTNATKLIWERFSKQQAHPSEWIPITSEPRYNDEQFNQRYYYDFILKPAIPVVLEMLVNGQQIDLAQVDELAKAIKERNDK